MKTKIVRWLILTGGILLIIIGTFSLLVPIFPGLLLIFLGLLVIFGKEKLLEKLPERLRKYFDKK